MTVTLGHFVIWDIWDLQVYCKMSRISFVTSENWREKSTRYLPHPSYTLLLPPDIPQTPSEIPRHSHITPDISKTLPKHSWHSTEIFWHPHFSQSPFWHPLTTQMALRLSDECWGVVKAVPGGQGNMFQVLVGVLECPAVFWGSWWCWGVYEGLWEVSDSLFPSIFFRFRKSPMRSV